MEIKFAENLKNLRATKKMTQGQLAHILGVDQRTVSAWEKGVCEPSFSILSNLCEIFEEDFNGLLT
ncbi:MAG: helix-turn-helix transcriptional regulator [Clostridia bacterium]|nr:helix-turn-helix transcriptional regulator [Clostridia bacterium]